MRQVLTAALLACVANSPTPVAVETKPPAVRFDSDVQAVLSRCRPCHYPGGVMYERLPFDNEAAVRKAGEKLFARIKDERERAMLRRFFAAAH